MINDRIRPNSHKNRGEVHRDVVDGSCVESPVDIANVFNSHFSTIGLNIADTFVNSSVEYSQFMSGNYDDSFQLSPVLVKDVRDCIFTLKNKKCNVDDLSVHV